MDKRDLKSALKFSDQSVAICEAAVKTGGGGAFALPGFLTRRSAVELAAGNSEQAVADANRGLTLLLPKVPAGTLTNKLGYAYLTHARALEARGQHARFLLALMYSFIELTAERLAKPS
jgi:hypothetical protein